MWQDRVSGDRILDLKSNCGCKKLPINPDDIKVMPLRHYCHTFYDLDSKNPAYVKEHTGQVSKSRKV